MGQDKHVYSIEWAGRKLTVEIGQLAKQANGAVLSSLWRFSCIKYSNSIKRTEKCRFLPVNCEL